MGYLHIDNLYKNQTILLFRHCYAMEKIHGTSAHVSYRDGRVTFSPGGETQERFAALFDELALTEAFRAVGQPRVTVYGEAYGGRQQRQAWRYGPDLHFVAFDVLVGESWLAVPSAERLARTLGLDFVSFTEISTDLASIDAERDAPSVQAARNGVTVSVPREGVVLRPLVEVRLNSGERVIAKHKRAEERETRSPRVVDPDPTAQQVLQGAQQIAEEWVTPRRLEHVLDKIPVPHDVTRTGAVVAAMIEDVLREGRGEIVDSRSARRAIGTRAATLFGAYLKNARRQERG